MGLRVSHSDRKRLDCENEPREFWEQVLNPKWEKRALDRAKKLRNYLKAQEIASSKGPTLQKPLAEPNEKLKIVIEADMLIVG